MDIECRFHMDHNGTELVYHIINIHIVSNSSLYIEEYEGDCTDSTYDDHIESAKCRTISTKLADAIKYIRMADSVIV